MIKMKHYFHMVLWVVNISQLVKLMYYKNILDYNLSMQEAIDYPRLCIKWTKIEKS